VANARKEPPIVSSPILFVLVGPRAPGNLGAVCRTAKAFGFPAVRLVRSPIDPADREAVRLAHGAEDVLAAVEAAPTLDAALQGSARAFATTARPRDWSRRVLSPDELALELADAAGAGAPSPAAPIAIVFGPEDRGLTNDELARCDAIVSIPITTPDREASRATLSLPAAHAIIAAAAARGLARAGAARPAARGSRSERGGRALASTEIDELLEEIRATLASIGFRARPNETRFRGSLRDFLARAHPTEGDRLFFRHILAQTGKWARRVAGER
jgi:TrmH family RNA methyltransferase